MINIISNLYNHHLISCVFVQVHVHGYDLQSLHKIVDPAILPEEYGGTDGKVQDLIGNYYLCFHNYAHTNRYKFICVPEICNQNYLRCYYKFFLKKSFHILFNFNSKPSYQLLHTSKNSCSPFTNSSFLSLYISFIIFSYIFSETGHLLAE